MGNNANKELIFPELSYKIIGAAFSTFNELGYGLSEKVYQRALAKELEKLGLKFEREFYIPLRYGHENLSRHFADFVVEGKILVELKVVKKLGYSHARQVLDYLHSSGMRLGILLYFTREGIKYRRIINSAAKDD